MIRIISLVIFSLIYSAQFSIAVALYTNHPKHSKSSSSRDSDTRKIVVLGDSLGEGVWSGLYWAFKPDRNIKVEKLAQLSTGLVRDDRFNWQLRVRELINNDKIDIAVFMVGTNDNQSIRTRGKIIRAYTQQWRDEYAKRVDNILNLFIEADIPIVWMGLPVMRPPKFKQVAEEVNDIFKERATLAGVPYISTWEAFVNQQGEYTAYTQDMKGKSRLMRAKDGVHFTPRGYRHLASLVENEIRYTLNDAKLDQNKILVNIPKNTEVDKNTNSGAKILAKSNNQKSNDTLAKSDAIKLAKFNWVNSILKRSKSLPSFHADAYHNNDQAKKYQLSTSLTKSRTQFQLN